MTAIQGKKCNLSYWETRPCFREARRAALCGEKHLRYGEKHFRYAENMNPSYSRAGALLPALQPLYQRRPSLSFTVLFKTKLIPLLCLPFI